VITAVRRALVAAVALLLIAAAPSPAGSSPGRGGRPTIDVLSSAPDQVTGGDALVRVRVPGNRHVEDVRVHLDGVDVTGALTADPAGHALVGLVAGMAPGPHTLTARLGPGARTELRLRNHPAAGPVFAGPKQYPFLCRTEAAGLGQPVVDNSDGQGMRVFALNPDGSKSTTVVGWSRDCAAPTVVDYLYRAADNRFKPLPADGSRPADLVTTTTTDGRTVDYVVRRERGTIDRFLYSVAMLAPLAEARAGTGASDPDDSAWNGRLVFWFDGGVAIGHDQGRIPGGALSPDALARGYAVVGSSGNDTSTHYNLVLAAENALMVKERFIEGHGVPRHTIGIGGSGGAIQQYVFGQNHGRAIIDGAIAAYSYPDMVTQTIHVSDCELLEYYFDVTDAANPRWRDWTARRLVEGLNASATVPNPYRSNAPGATECVIGWRGLTPLANNPLWTRLDPLWAQMDPPGVAQTVQWTHWGDLVNIYGVGPDGYARSTFDNVGVQYGLSAVAEGELTPAEFLDLNAKVGSWKPAAEMVQEGCPFTPAACADPAQFDPWSARNMRHSPDGGVTPAPRTTGDRAAIAAAYEAGLVFTGEFDLPVIDWRHYLEERLDMHNSHQSFATRARLRAAGRTGNQVIWFTDARPAPAVDQQPEALAVMDQWLTNLRAHPGRGVTGNRPALAVDRCFATDGRQLAAGPHVWDGVLDDRAPGACTAAFPLHGTSRTVAGGPLAGGVYACARQPVARAIARGLYGQWRPNAAERARLEQIFPTGVCDYRKGDAARPR
jgi:hypothetical protein